MKVLVNKITNNYGLIYRDYYGTIEEIQEDNNTPTLLEDFLTLDSLIKDSYRSAQKQLENYELIEVELIRK